MGFCPISQFPLWRLLFDISLPSSQNSDSMPEVTSNAVTKIYENTQLTVKAKIDKKDTKSIEEVTFKFLKDGEQFEEKTIPISEGTENGEYTIVSHAVQAPAVPDVKDRYFLDYHYF